MRTINNITDEWRDSEMSSDIMSIKIIKSQIILYVNYKFHPNTEVINNIRGNITFVNLYYKFRD